MAEYKIMKTIKFPGSDIIYDITDDNKVDKDQGINNAGKVLCVGDDGLVTLIEMDSAGTGSSGTSSITVDAELSDTSTNPVQNKVVNTAINECITGMSVSGKTITYTKKDGSSDTITTQDTTYTHPSYTSYTGSPTANAEPSFGGTFSVSQCKTNATGHVTALTARTVKIPNDVATTSAAGLMSAGDKTKLDNIETTIDNKIKAAIGDAIGGSY